ncbi:MAG: hypothetical protein ACRDZO_10175 [Egibacteraceae bacterium]
MGRPERPIDPKEGPLQRFAVELRQLRQGAGGPSYRQLAKRACYSVTALSEAAGGERFPTLDVTLAYVKACDGDVPEWEARWREVAAELAAPNGASAQAELATGVKDAPYLGLDAFQPEDADRFFGRHDDVARVVGKLADSRFLAVLGPSGCGKSSLVRAGVVPALARGAVVGSDSWTPRIVTPTSRPLSILAAVLGRLLPDESMQETINRLEADKRSVDLAVSLAFAERGDGERLLLVVDQFEETFTLCADEGARAIFVANLCHAATVPGGRAVVLLAMRADFYHHCAAYPQLAELMADRQFLVSPLGSQGLRQVIEEPARRAGLEMDAGLVETILADVADRPGTLPLLEYVLLEVWRRRRKTSLTLEAYVASGGVERALAQRADAIYQAFTPGQRQVARRVLLRLIQPSEGAEDTRRRAEYSELLTPGEEGELEAVVGAMANARLLTTSRDEVSGTPVVDVSHEALIRGWPRLRGWIDEDRDLLRAQRRLTDAAIEWNDNGRADGFLYGEGRLAAWRDRPTADLNHREREFLTASERHEERKRATARRRARLAALSLTAVLTVITVLAVWAAVNRTVAITAFSRQVATRAQAQLALDPELSVLLAKEALEISPTPEAEASLRQALLNLRPYREFEGHEGPANDAVFSPDGQRLFSIGEDGSLRTWDLTGQLRPVVVHEGPMKSLAIRPDGRQLASTGEDGTLRLWDLVDGADPLVLRGHEGIVYAVAFSPDGQRVATGGEDTTVRVWGVAGGGEPVVLRHDGSVYGVAFGPDGTRLAATVADGTVRIWDLVGGAEPIVLRGHQGPVYGVAFSPDGQRVASAGFDGTLRFWDLATGAASAVLRGDQGIVWEVAFSPDGRQVASANNDGTVHIWDSSGQGDPLVLRGQKGPVWDVAFSPDGRRLGSPADDGRVRVWDIQAIGGKVFSGHLGSVYRVAFSPDGRQAASAGQDGTVRIWNGITGTASGAEPLILRGHEGYVYGVAFSPNGRRLASAGQDGAIRVWTPGTTADPLVLRGHRGSVNSVAFSPNGQQVASAGGDGTVRVWNLATGADFLVLNGHDGPVERVAFHPDGQRVASAGQDGTVRVWNLATGADPLVFRGTGGPMWSVTFSPDGQRVASAGQDGILRLWALERGAVPVQLIGHEGAAYDVAFSPDGHWLVSGGEDSTVRVWEAAGGSAPVVFRGHADLVFGVALSPDGRWLASSSYDSTTRVWSCSVCRPIAEMISLADERATRELTPEERQAFLTESPRS